MNGFMRLDDIQSTEDLSTGDCVEKIHRMGVVEAASDLLEAFYANEDTLFLIDLGTSHER